MNILVQVKEGRIEILDAKDRGPSAFGQEPDAAQYLAERVAKTSAPVSFHHSCSYPSDHGRPGFSKPAFMEEVKDRIYLIQQADRIAPRAM